MKKLLKKKIKLLAKLHLILKTKKTNTIVMLTMSVIKKINNRSKKKLKDANQALIEIKKLKTDVINCYKNHLGL